MQNSYFSENADNEKVLVFYYLARFRVVEKTVDTLSVTCMFPKTSACVKSYDSQAKWTYFLIEDDDLLENHNTV